MRRCMDVLKEIVKKHQETMHQREVRGGEKQITKKRFFFLLFLKK